MKRIVLFIISIVFVVLQLHAQDTVDYWRGNYYLGYELNPKTDSVFYNDMAPGVVFNGKGGIVAKYFMHEGKDSLRVVGVAAALASLLDIQGGEWPPLYDTINDSIVIDNTWFTFRDSSSANCFGDLGIYKHEGDTLRLLDEVRVHRLADTPAYYHQAIGQCSSGPEFHPIYGVYEKFFDDPLALTDSFYVGFKMHYCFNYIDSLGDYWIFSDMPLCLLTYTHVNPDVRIPEHHALRLQHLLGRYAEWIFEYGDQPYMSYYCIFPILAPVDTTVTPVDTTVTPIDTTTAGVSWVDMVGRYVSVSPNPAGDRATVLSSFGLTRIEAYDPQGRQLYAAPATGLRTTLDVSTWPRGTALLHIHTPAGTTVKKLLLR